jgi:hypothetical protein
MNIDSIRFPSTVVNLANFLFPSFTEALTAFLVSDVALEVCEAAPTSFKIDLILEGSDAASLPAFKAALIPGFTKFLESKAPCFFPQLPVSLQPHYSALFVPAAVPLQLESIPAEDATARALETFGFSVLGRLSTANLEVSEEEHFELLDGVKGRFMALKDGGMTLALFDLERKCMVYTTHQGAHMLYLPQQSVVSYTDAQAELVIHREDRRPIKLRGSTVGMLVDSLVEFPEWHEGFEVIFTYTDKYELMQLIASEDIEDFDATRNFNFRVIQLQPLQVVVDPAMFTLESTAKIRVLEDTMVVSLELETAQGENEFRDLLTQIENERADVIHVANGSGNFKGNFAVVTDADINFTYIAQITSRALAVSAGQDTAIILTVVGV